MWLAVIWHVMGAKSNPESCLETVVRHHKQLNQEASYNFTYYYRCVTNVSNIRRLECSTFNAQGILRCRIFNFNPPFKFPLMQLPCTWVRAWVVLCVTNGVPNVRGVPRFGYKLAEVLWRFPNEFAMIRMTYRCKIVEVGNQPVEWRIDRQYGRLKNHSLGYLPSHSYFILGK